MGTKEEVYRTNPKKKKLAELKERMSNGLNTIPGKYTANTGVKHMWKFEVIGIKYPIVCHCQFVLMN
jgi:hypothetical protein